MTRALPRSMSHANTRRAGFTLVEVLTAAIAGAVILAAVYAVFARAVHLRDKATARTQEARLRARAENVLRSDLRNALISGGKLAAHLTGSRTNPNSQFPGYLRFATTTGRIVESGEVVAGDVQEVEYGIAPTADATDRKSGTLVRTVYRNPLGSLQEAIRDESLLEGVQAMEVSFYNGQTWADSWEVTATETTLPQGIRVRLLMSEAALSAVPVEITMPWTTAAAIEPVTP